MSEWKECKLGDIAIITDCEHKTAPLVDSSEFISVRTSNIQNGRIDFENSNRVSSQVYEEWTKRLKPNDGDIVLAREAPVGEVGWIPKGKKVCLGQRTVLIRTTDKSINPKYLLYNLVNDEVKNDLINRSTGSVVEHLNVKDIKNFDLRIHNLLEEQVTIASILSSLDDKIDLLHRQNTTLEAMAETLFRQWFVEEAKEDWEEVSLKEFISIKHGYAFKGNYISTEPTNLILVTPGNFKIGGGFKFDKFKYYTNEEFPKDYIFKASDLIVTMTDLSVDGNTLGYPAFVPENYSNEVYLHNQRVGKVEFRNEIGKYFLHQLMKTDDYQWFVLGGASGTAIRHTSPTSICNYSFKMPPKSKILEFETFANGLEEKNKKNQIQIRTLTALRDTLLPKLMSGEIRVEM